MMKAISSGRMLVMGRILSVNFLTPEKSAKKFVGIQMPSFYKKNSQIFLKREGFLVHSPSSAGPGVSLSSPMPWPVRPPPGRSSGAVPTVAAAR